MFFWILPWIISYGQKTLFLIMVNFLRTQVMKKSETWLTASLCLILKTLCCKISKFNPYRRKISREVAPAKRILNANDARVDNETAHADADGTESRRCSCSHVHKWKGVLNWNCQSYFQMWILCPCWATSTTCSFDRVPVSKVKPFSVQS